MQRPSPKPAIKSAKPTNNSRPSTGARICIKKSLMIFHIISWAFKTQGHRKAFKVKTKYSAANGKTNNKARHCRNDKTDIKAWYCK